MSNKSTVCLCMIVKDEEKDIERCLSSVKDHIDYWVISDTGSRDNTIEKIKSLMAEYGIDGELHEHKWVDFATNRNNVIDLARSKADYLWFMDADDNYVAEEGKALLDGIDPKEELLKMNFIIEGSFQRECLFKSSADISYHGVLHEFLYFNDLKFDKHVAPLDNGYIVARSSPEKRAKTKQEKFLNDAKILQNGLKKENNKFLQDRYTYYLAQSYQNAQKYGAAIKWYQRRLKGNYSSIETYMSLYNTLLCTISLYPNDHYKITNAAIDCWKQFPNRIEPIHAAVVSLLFLGQPEIAFLIGDAPSKLAAIHPGDTFVKEDVYEIKFPIAYALSAYMMGNEEVAKIILESRIEKFKKEEKPKFVLFVESFIKGLDEGLTYDLIKSVA